MRSTLICARGSGLQESPAATEQAADSPPEEAASDAIPDGALGAVAAADAAKAADEAAAATAFPAAAATARADRAAGSAGSAGELPLAAGWEQCMSKSRGRPYFFHRETGTTVWKRPTPIGSLHPQTAGVAEPKPGQTGEPETQAKGGVLAEPGAAPQAEARAGEARAGEAAEAGVEAAGPAAEERTVESLDAAPAGGDFAGGGAEAAEPIEGAEAAEPAEPVGKATVGELEDHAENEPRDDAVDELEASAQQEAGLLRRERRAGRKKMVFAAKVERRRVAKLMACCGGRVELPPPPAPPQATASEEEEEEEEDDDDGSDEDGLPGGELCEAVQHRANLSPEQAAAALVKAKQQQQQAAVVGDPDPEVIRLEGKG